MNTNANHLVDKIYQILKHQIKSNLYKINEKIPSIRKLCKQYSVSKNTIIQALERLVDEGLLYSKPASGFFVMQQKQLPHFKQTKIEMQNIDEFWLMRRQLETFNAVINVSDGFPDSTWFELLPLNRLLQKSLHEHSPKLLRYGSKYGFENLREILCIRLSQYNIKVLPDNILLTNGVNDAIDLIIRYFVDANTTVLVDSPIYYPLLKKLQLTQCNIVEIPRMIDGPDCQILEEMLLAHKPKLFFTQSILHNPTGTDISIENIKIVNQLCHQYHCLLIENDIFAEYTETKYRLCSHCDFSNHLYIGGFSKIISPSIRVGFIVGDYYLVDKLADFKAILHVNSSEYAERFISTIIQDKSYFQHIEFFRKRLKESNTQASENIKKLGGEIFNESSHSLYYWTYFRNLNFTKNTINHLIENRFIFAPGYIFSIDGKSYNQWTRLNVGVAAKKEFYDNLTILFNQNIL